MLGAGVTGLGRAVTFIPWPVIEGFTLGIAAIIFLQQVPAALGTTSPAGERTLTAACRTAVNVRSGARTRLSAIVHSAVLLGVVYLATGPVAAIPLAALAGVLMVTSFRMIAGSTIRKILRSTRSDALTFVLTAVVTVCFDLIEAVEIGIVVAAFFALRSVARRSSVVREELPGPHRRGTRRSPCSAWTAPCSSVWPNGSRLRSWTPSITGRRW